MSDPIGAEPRDSIRAALDGIRRRYQAAQADDCGCHTDRSQLDIAPMLAALEEVLGYCEAIALDASEHGQYADGANAALASVRGMLREHLGGLTNE